MIRLIEARAAEEREEIERRASAIVADAKERAEERVAAEVAAIEHDAQTRIAAARAGRRPSAPPQASPSPPQPAGESMRSRYDEMARQFAATSAARYTVQVAIVCETASVTRALQAGASSVWFVPITYRGRSCYRVFWGHFATRDEAQRAISSVPDVLRSSGPVVVREPSP
jgi:septal ring-binding cell division protein DamX